jgi:cyclohexadienyl dehydratase
MKKTIALLFITFSFSAFAGTALTHILKRGTLRVCTTGDYPPLTRLRLGKYSGTTIIAARAFAKTLSVKADFIHATYLMLAIVTSPWAASPQRPYAPTPF